MELIHEFTYQATLAAPLVVGDGPYGSRVVVPAIGGKATGARISGTFVGGGGDWLLIGTDGWGRLDVRAQLETDDGALIYLTYSGLLEVSDTVMGALLTPGASTQFDDQYFRTTPRMETGDARYAWVNSTLFVARGRLIGDGVEYEVFRVS